VDGLTGLGPAVEPPLDVWQSALASALSSTTAPAELAALVPPGPEVAGWSEPEGEGPDGDDADLPAPAGSEAEGELSWDDPCIDPPGHLQVGDDWLDEAASDEGWA
jgi:hypothetical protein